MLREGDTFDLTVLDTALTYQKYQRDKEDGKIADGDMYDMSSLKELAEKAKNRHNENNS